MSSDDTFDLEPAAPAPAPRRKTGRLRTTPARRRGQGSRRGDPLTPPPPGRLERYLGWIVAPRVHYGLGLLLGVLCLLAEPLWGPEGARWPHERIGLGAAPFSWNAGTVETLSLLLFALALLAALLLRAGGRRGLIVLVGAALVAAPQRDGADLVVLGVLALTGGALLAGAGTRRGTLLAIGLGLLAAHLFLPWAPERFHRGIEVAPDYQATAFDAIDALAAPRAADLEAHGHLGLALERSETSIALLLAGVGLLALVGLGGGWARWAAGILLLLLTACALVVLLRDAPGSGWSAGALAVARDWLRGAAAYALVAAAAVAEVAAARGEAWRDRCHGAGPGS